MGQAGSFSSFANTFVKDTLRADGNPALLGEQRRLLDERASDAPDAERALIVKLVHFLEAVSFPHEPLRTDSHAFVDWAEWFKRRFPWVVDWNAMMVPILARPQSPIPFLSLCHPTNPSALAFLGKADSSVVESVYLAWNLASMESWESLLEIMKNWTGLKNVTFSSSFFEGSTAVVKLFVDNLDIDGFTFHGPVVKALGPDFFKDRRPCNFSFPSTAAYAFQTATWPLFECCSSADITAFFAGLPATAVSFGAGDCCWDKPGPEHLQPLVEALNALSCTGVSLINFPGIESCPELLIALFGGEFTELTLDSASTEISVWPGFADIVAANSTLESLEVRYFGDFGATVLELSTSIRQFSFAGFADPTCRKECVLNSELESLNCSGLDLEAEKLCGVLREAREEAEQRAHCLLHCCLQLAPTAHEHIVPSIGAVPLHVLRGGVRSAGELMSEPVSRETVSREKKRGTSPHDGERDLKRR